MYDYGSIPRLELICQRSSATSVGVIYCPADRADFAEKISFQFPCRKLNTVMVPRFHHRLECFHMAATRSSSAISQNGINTESVDVPSGFTAWRIILKSSPSEYLPIPVLISGVKFFVYNIPIGPKGNSTPPLRGRYSPASAAIISAILAT